MPFGGSAIAIAVFIIEGVGRIVKSLEPRIPGIGLVDGAGPAEMFVVANRGQGTAEKGGTGKVQSFSAAHVGFIELAETVIGLVRVGIEHGRAVARAARADRVSVAADKVGLL